jgi:hypothetical protein
MTKASALPCAVLLLAALLALRCLVQLRDAGAAEAITMDFDASAVGTFPTGFSSAVTGGGGPASWAVVEDFTAPSGGKVLAQTSTDKTSVRFPLCVYDGFMASDVMVSVSGDFAMLESELQPVLKALRGAGINIVAIHNHMASESPRILFLHYWGIGATRELARGLKAALDQTQHQ